MDNVPSCLRLLLMGVAIALLLSTSAFAQVNPELANCKELTDPATIEQVEICQIHPGCRLVIGIYKACTAVRSFIDRLSASIGPGVKTFFGYRKEVQSENVFDASLGEEARRVASDPAWQAQSAAVEKLTKQAGRSELSGNNGRRNWTYIGDVKDGSPNGAGTAFYDDGEIARGQYKSGHIDGLGDVSFANGERQVGERYDGKLSAGLVIRPTGVELRGQFSQNRLNGEGSVKLKDGTRYEGQFAAGTLVDGNAYRPDGSLAEKGRFDVNFQLQVGERFDVAGKLTENVDRPLQLAQAEQAKRQAAEDQQRQAEADRQRDEAQKKLAAVAEQRAFQDALESMNPGQLLALANEMSTAHTTLRARQALRALVSRFPDHPLAVTAAAQLAEGGVHRTPPVAAASRVAGPVSSGSNNCVRKVSARDDRIKQRAMQDGVMFYPGVSGLFEVRMSEMTIQMLEPCRGDPETDRQIKQLQQGINWLKANCSPEKGGAQDYCSQEFAEPDQRGGRGAQNMYRRFFAIYEDETRQAMSQPLASGEPVGVPASPGQAASGRFAPWTGNVCAGEPLRSEAYSAAMSRIPQNETTMLIRGAIVGIDAQLLALRNCSPSPQILQAISSLQSQRDAALGSCRQISANDNCLQPPF
jgi:hypothetical protein